MAGPARLCRGRPDPLERRAYRVAKKLWRADRGLDWNPGRYEVGEEIVNIEGNVYRCTESSGAGAPLADWGRFPRGTGDAIAEDQGNLRYVWRYVGRFGESGETPPFAKKKTVRDNNQDWFLDGLVQWQYLSADYAPEKAAANFADWKSKVMDPVVRKAIERGLYVVIAISTSALHTIRCGAPACSTSGNGWRRRNGRITRR